jgi:hypothetical protein
MQIGFRFPVGPSRRDQERAAIKSSTIARHPHYLIVLTPHFFEYFVESVLVQQLDFV